jgi:chemotaxis protein CheD
MMTLPLRSEQSFAPRGMPSAERRKLVNITAGEWYVTAEPSLLSTVLGSCVAACMRDPVSGVCGINHFLLPESSLMPFAELRTPTMFGDRAMAELLDAMLMQGARHSRIEVKLFGGACLYETANDVGNRNACWVLKDARNRGLRVNLLDSHLCGDKSRRIHFCTVSGVVMQSCF